MRFARAAEDRGDRLERLALGASRTALDRIADVQLEFRQQVRMVQRDQRAAAADRDELDARQTPERPNGRDDDDGALAIALDFRGSARRRRRRVAFEQRDDAAAEIVATDGG